MSIYEMVSRKLSCPLDIYLFFSLDWIDFLLYLESTKNNKYTTPNLMSYKTILLHLKSWYLEAYPVCGFANEC